MIRVFLVDDHEIVRRGIAQLVDAEADLQVVGEAGTVREATRRVAATKPDVAVLDVRLPDGDGIDLCRAIRSAQPEVFCLMLTGYDDDHALQSAILAGASGYVLKDIRSGRLVRQSVAQPQAARSSHPKSCSARCKCCYPLRPTR